MPFVNADGARIHWRVDGHADAPPLLMISSLGSDHAMWEPVLPALTRYFRVIRLDKRGHGASDAPPGDYTMERLGRDALAVADAAGLRRFLYAGLSIGGMIGMWLAQNAPERIERMVLSNTSAQVAPETFAQRITQIMLHGMTSIADVTMGRWFTPRYLARDTAHLHTTRQTLVSTDPIGYAGCCAAIRDMQLVSGLASITTPTLVISGLHDPSTPAEQGRRIARAITGARYAELPTAHFAPAERPAQWADLAIRFLSGETVGAAGAEVPPDAGQPLPAPAPRTARDDHERSRLGTARRRQVLGDGYVDARLADRNPLSREFQDLVTRWVWGETWSRTVFDDRTRRLMVLAMMVGMGRWEEFRLQVTQGLHAELEPAELEELLLTAAAYCGVPAANTGFHHASDILQN